VISRLAFVSTFAMAVSTASAQPPRPPHDEPSPAPADDKRRIVGVLDVRVEGVPKEIARQFQSELEKQLDSREYWLAPQQRIREMMANSTKWTEGCLVGLCLTELQAITGAELVLLASISGSGTSFGYVVTLVRTDTGRVLAQEGSRCEVCTVKEALASATLAAVKLLTSVPDKLPDEAGEASAAFELATGKLHAQIDASKRHNRKLGIGLTLAGVVAAGAGMTLYLAADRPAYALGIAGLGAGTALGGIAVLTF
jgi:hypothetical protein